MIRPEEFYESATTLTGGDRERLWHRIQHSLPLRPMFVIPDGRSFMYGMAAAFLLGFALFGVVQAVRAAREGSETRLVRAYKEAIHEFEEVVPASGAAAGKTVTGREESWKAQLALVDAAVRDLDREITQTGPSPVKDAKLRELYALKLQVLQTMIENGGVDL